MLRKKIGVLVALVLVHVKGFLTKVGETMWSWISSLQSGLGTLYSLGLSVGSVGTGFAGRCRAYMGGFIHVRRKCSIPFHRRCVMRKVMIGLLVLLTGVPMAYAGTNVWTPKNDGLYGAWPNALAISPDGGTVYAGVQGGVYKSTDGGDSWEQILGRTVKALIINPQTPSTIYAGTEGNGVYRSMDGGDSWEPINEGLTNLDVRALAIDPIAPTTIYAGAGDGVFKSIDGGDNWEPKNAGLINTDIWSLAINPGTPTTIFVGTGDGLYRSTDGGDEWTRIGSEIIGWRVKALAIDPQSPSTIYAGGGGLFKSTDGGDNWVLIFEINVSTLVINPSVLSTLYAGQWGNPNALFKSIDGGDNWTPTGLFATPVLVLSINPSESSIIYAGTMNDLFTSTDGGDSWARTGCGITHVKTIAIHPDFPDIIYTGGDMGGGVGYVYRSTDGGDSWEDVTDGITTSNVYALAINPDFPGVIYAGTEDGIYRSINGGDTWEDITNGIHPDVRAIAIHPDVPDIIYAGTDGGVFKSTDGGDNWEEKGLTDPGVTTLAINPAAPNIIYAGTRGIGVYRSTDNGDSWTQVRGGLPEYAHVYSFAISSSGYIFAGIGNNVFMSTDNGESWINTGLTQTANALAIDPQHPQTVYAGVWGGVYHFFLPEPVITDVIANPGYMPPDSLVTLTATVTDPDGVASVLAEIESPDETVQATIELFDDGAHGDGAAGDSTYGNTWTTLSTPMTYVVDILATDMNGNSVTMDNAALFTTDVSSLPQPLTTDEGFDGYPSMAQMSDGTIWVVWTSSRGSYHLWYKRSSDGGSTWSEPQQLTFEDSYDFLPSIAQAADGTIWVVWWRAWDDIWYKTSSDSGATWSEDTQFTADPEWDIYPCIAADATGRIIVTWSSRRSGNWDVYYKLSLDNGATWSAPVQRTTDLSSDYDPSVAIDGEGGIHIIWFSYRSGNADLWYVKSEDDGDSWSTPTQLTRGSERDYDPSIEVDALGRIWVAWMRIRENQWYNSDIFHMTSDDGVSWSSPAQFTRFTGRDEWPDISIVSDQPWVAWNSDRAVNYDIWLGVLGITQDSNPPPHADWVTSDPYSPAPLPDDVITLRAKVTDETGVQSVQAVYSVDGVGQAPLEMYDDGAHNDDGAGDEVWGVQIGPYPAGTVIEFQVEAEDISGNTILAPQYPVRIEVIAPFVPTSDLLVVADYTWHTEWFLRYYTDALDANGYAYDVWDGFLRGEIDGETLDYYTSGTVIWSTPYWGYITYASVQSNLQSYLDAGGRLFISGQNIGRYINSTALYSDYLHASYVQDNVDLYALSGVEGDPITEGLSLSITGGDGAGDQYSPEEIDPLPPAVAIFTYESGEVEGSSMARAHSLSTGLAGDRAYPRPDPSLAWRAEGYDPEQRWEQEPAAWEKKSEVGISDIGSSGTGALRVDTGVYRVVYFAFGFEGINNAEDRNTVMGRVLSWLRPGVRVSVPDTTAASGSQIALPVRIEHLGEVDVFSAEMTLSFDPAVLEADSVSLEGTLAEDWMVSFRADVGLIEIAIAGSDSLAGAGTLAYVVFDVVGSEGDTTSIHFEELMLNEGDPEVYGQDGVFAVSGAYEISGEMLYYARELPIEGVSVQLSGDREATVLTDSSGFYQFEGLASGYYVTRPGKAFEDQEASITPYDASLVLREYVDLIELDPYQRLAGDVTGNGELSAYDASYILRYYVRLIDRLPAGDWRFVPWSFPIDTTNWSDAPDSLVYSPLDSSRREEAYWGMVLGDVSGNWRPSGVAALLARSVVESSEVRVVSLGDVSGDRGERVRLAVKVDDGEGIFSAGMTITYDPEVLRAVDALVTELTSGYVMAHKAEEGRIRIALAGARALKGGGAMVEVAFEVLKAVDRYGSSRITFEQVQLNEGRIPVVVQSAHLVASLPEEFALSQNYPNPFNPATTIVYQLPVEAEVRLEIYSILGQRVRVLVDGVQEAGYYAVGWDGRDEVGQEVGVGIYLYRLQADHFVRTKKLVIIK